MTDPTYRRLALFYGLALGISWAGWIPFGAWRAGVLTIEVPWEIPLLAQFGPSIAAFILASREAGRAGMRRLLGQVVRWRIGLRWYAVALLLTPAIAAVSLAVHAAVGDDLPGPGAFSQWYASYAESFGSGGVYALDESRPPSLGVISFLREAVARSPWLAVANFLAFSLLTGPVSEEFGWRGYALPRVQARWGALKASLIVGVLWGFWHTGPDFWRLLFQGNPMALLYPVAMTLGTVPLSILLAWLYNRTGASLLPPMLFHASFNATLSILAAIWTARSPLLIGAELVAGLWIAAAVVIIWLGFAAPSETPANPDDS